MGDEINLGDYLSAIRRNITLFLTVFFIVFSTCTIYTFNTPQIYEAKSQIVFNSPDQTMLTPGSASAPKADIETEKQVILSQSILNPIFERYAGTYFELNANTFKDSNIIEIVADAKDPFIAADIANAVAYSYINYSIESKKDNALNVNKFITEQINMYDEELAQMNTALLYYRYKGEANLTTKERIAYQNLVQNVAAKNKLYDFLLSKKEEMGIASKQQSGNVKIIQQAFASSEPLKPNKLLYLFAGFILGMIGGVGVVMSKNRFDDIYSGTDDVEGDFGEEIIGTLPRIKDASGHVVKGGADDEFAKKNSEFAENIKIIRTNLTVNLKDVHSRTICVTSPGEGEGKTILATNLALALSQAGNKVLLVDCNLRNPKLAEVFSLGKDSAGVSQALLKDSDAHRKAAKTKFDNLYVIPAGKKAVDPGEVFSFDSIKRLVEKLNGGKFDFVIFDAPALMFAESRDIALNSGSVLLVIAEGMTKRKLAREAKKSIGKHDDGFVGVVVNFSD